MPSLCVHYTTETVCFYMYGRDTNFDTYRSATNFDTYRSATNFYMYRSATVWICPQFKETSNLFWTFLNFISLIFFFLRFHVSTPLQLLKPLLFPQWDLQNNSHLPGYDTDMSQHFANLTTNILKRVAISNITPRYEIPYPLLCERNSWPLLS